MVQKDGREHIFVDIPLSDVSFLKPRQDTHKHTLSLEEKWRRVKKKKKREHTLVQCEQATIPIPSLHRGSTANSKAISDRAIAADSVLSNYVGGGAALATFGLTLLALCKGTVCLILGCFNLLLTAVFLIVSAMHYFRSIDNFHRLHSYTGNRFAAILIVVQAIAVIGLVAAQVAGVGV